MGIVCLEVGFIVLAGTEEADVLLEVVVNFTKSVGAVDDGEEPARPCEGCVICTLEKGAVELVDESLHRFFGFEVVLAAPAHE